MIYQTVAGVLILIAAGLIVFFDWVPTPLNRNIEGMSARERAPSTIIHGLAGIVFATCCFLSVWPAYWAAAIWYGLVLVSAIRNWWQPYLGARYNGELTADIYARVYARNLTILPRIGTHPVIPDVQHMLIHLALLLAMFGALTAAVFA